VKRCIAVAASLLLAAACGGNPPLPASPKGPPPVGSASPAGSSTAAAAATTPDAPFRAEPPPPSGTVDYAPPNVESFTLSNGIGVLFVQRHDLPILAVRVVLRAGAGDLPGAKPGVMSFLGNMLENGTQKRTALQVSDDYEAVGAEHATWVDWDSGGAWVRVLAPKADAALEVLSDVLEHPAFPQAEIERVRMRRLTGLQQQKNSVQAQAFNTVAASVYGRTNVYGHSLSGTPDDAKALTRDDLVRAYGSLFAPGNVSIAVCGDTTAAALKTELESRFGAWKGTAPKPVFPSAPAQPTGPRIEMVDFPHATQSMVLLADVGVAMSSHDRDALKVMEAILGGMFSSRINLDLREKNNFTYGAFAGFDMRHGPGPFFAGGMMHAENTADSVTALLSEVQKMHDAPVTDTELADAKEYIVRALPARFETVADVTEALAQIAAFGLPSDEYATLPARIRAVSSADVQRVAAQYLRPDKLKIVVVGDRASTEASLKALNLGAIEARDAYGDVVK
jgi:predicted Zn-dependent peptidase